MDGMRFFVVWWSFKTSPYLFKGEQAGRDTNRQRHKQAETQTGRDANRQRGTDYVVISCKRITSVLPTEVPYLGRTT